MASASSVTLRNRQRVLYYNAIINQAAVNLGVKIGSPSLTFADVAGAKAGALKTSVLEQAGYLNGIIDQVVGKMMIWRIYDGRNNNPAGGSTPNQMTSRTVPVESYIGGDKAAVNRIYASIDDGPYNMLSTPNSADSAINSFILSGLTPGKTQTFRVKGFNFKYGFGLPSDAFTVTTPLITVLPYTNPGTYIWDAPPGVSTVQALIVGGGGGGGGCYSNVISIGTIPWAETNPGGASTYWISSVNGRMYQGSTLYNSPFSANLGFTALQLSISGCPNAPTGIYVNQNFTYRFLEQYNSNSLYAEGFLYGVMWVAPFQATYFIINGIPYASNPHLMNINNSNNQQYWYNDDINRPSGGSGGGAGGQVYNNLCQVSSLSNYTIIVGAGGKGGGAGPGLEYNGSPGGISVFGAISSIGGSGGASSMNPNLIRNGYGYGGFGGFAFANTYSQYQYQLSTISTIIYSPPYNKVLINDVFRGDTFNALFEDNCELYKRTYFPGQFVASTISTFSRGVLIPGDPEFTLNDITLANPPTQLTVENLYSIRMDSSNRIIYSSRNTIDAGSCGFQFDKCYFAGRFIDNIRTFNQLYSNVQITPRVRGGGAPVSPVSASLRILYEKNDLYGFDFPGSYSTLIATTGGYLIDLYNNGNLIRYGMPGIGGESGLVTSNPPIEQSFDNVYRNGGNGNFPTFSTISPPNTGQGGFGTGALVGSYASGMDGGSGVVIITYS